MEKESADKATTELDNSVTSEEQGSLAEQNEGKNGETVEPVSEPAQVEVAVDKVEPSAGDAEQAAKEAPVTAKTTTPEEAVVNPAAPVADGAPPEKTTPAEEAAPPEVAEDKAAATTTADAPDGQEETVTGAGKEKELSKEEAEQANKAIADLESKRVDEVDHDEFSGVDFTTYTREQLVEVVKKLGKEENPFKADKVLQQIAPAFNKLRDELRQEALQKFMADGGSAEDFQYQPDELSLRFDANYKLIKDKKAKKYKEQDAQRKQNLVLAEQVLEELRTFVDSEESSGSFNKFKEIQQKWKDIGDVPPQHSRTLWASYNALVHRFYDQRSIYFELKELDRKKNYEAKLVLCEKAEALAGVENIREAIKGLNDLHHEFKHLGPVPRELQEDLWQRFKAASDKVYERRKVFVHELKAELHENLLKKQELVDKVKELVAFQSDRIKEWNEKTREVLNLQKSWEAIGGLPKDKAKVINKEFWSSFKKFFSNKHQFFKSLESERAANLEKKQALLARAKELMDSEEWDSTAEELKKLQSQWREIGPVPEKVRQKLYEEFKAACDRFFENKRSGRKQSQEQYKENLKKKKEIIARIAQLQEAADDNLEEFNALRQQFLEIGYVPRKNIGSIKEAFQQAVNAYMGAVTSLNEKEKAAIMLEAEFSGLAASDHSEKELYQKEQAVRRQINKLEDDIALWQNNLEFFAASKSTDKLREEVNKKIADANIHLEGLKRQLKMLRSL